MSDDELGYEPAPSQLSSRRKTAIWAAAGLLGIGAVGVAIVTEVGSHPATASTTVAAGAPTVASSAAPAPAPSGSAAPKRGGGKGSGGPRGFGGAGGFGAFGGFGGFGGIGGIGGIGGAKTLHSEATVESAKGTTEIVDTQNGKITAVSGSAVTVTSTDNVAFTYTVTSTSRLVVVTAATAGGKPTVNAKATVTDLKVGDTVNVSAVRSGATRTVSSLADGLPTFAARGVGAGHFGGPGGGPRPDGTASPSPKASTAAGATT